MSLIFTRNLVLLRGVVRFQQKILRVPEELFGTLLPAGRSNFGGSPRTQSLLLAYRSRRHTRWAKGRRRSLLIRPYLHARITRITSVEQLPQIISGVFRVFLGCVWGIFKICLWWNYGGIMVELWWNYAGIMIES